MKIVINKTFGGYSVPDEMQKILECDKYSNYVRTDPRFIEYVENNKGRYNFDLGVVDIPEEATEWRIEEYDGRENIVAVINGKIEKYYA